MDRIQTSLYNVQQRAHGFQHRLSNPSPNFGIFEPQETNAMVFESDSLYENVDYSLTNMQTYAETMLSPKLGLPTLEAFDWLIN